MKLSPIVKTLYQKILEDIKIFGEVIVEENKTSIHLKHRVAFAGLHPRKDYLYLEIVSDAPIKNSRIFRVEQLSRNRYHNHIKLESVQDIDRELQSMLETAYNLSA